MNPRRHSNDREQNQSPVAIQPAPNFRDLFCKQFHVSTSRYRRAVLRRSLFRGTLPLALLFNWIRPSFFARDDAVIRSVGETTTVLEFEQALNQAHRVDIGTLKARWGLRISGRRLLDLGITVFASHRSGNRPV
jgi:hypothetical protein